MSGLKLVYQPVPPDHIAFNRAIEEVIHNSSRLQIVGPYLGAKRLSDWSKRCEIQLITDISACLSRADGNLLEFLKSNLEKIRNLPGVHAKVIIGDRSVLFGSANWTETAIDSRNELSCLCNDEFVVKEIREWFDTIWRAAEFVEEDKLSADYSVHRQCTKHDPEIALINKQLNYKPITHKSNGPKSNRIQSADTPISPPIKPNPPVTEEDIESLAQCLRKVCKEDQLNAIRLLELYQEAFKSINLPVDSKFLHMNFGQYLDYYISITLGQRYAIWSGQQIEDIKGVPPVVGFLLTDFELADKYQRYDVHKKKTSFSKKEKPEFPSFYWPISELSALPDEILADWHRGIRQERDLKKNHVSSYLRYKKPALYPLIMDEALRAQVLKRAYPA